MVGAESSPSAHDPPRAAAAHAARAGDVRSATRDRGRVLVVTPTYNELPNLPGFAEAVLAVGPDVDLLVVDDASPDGTGAEADRLAAASSRVTVLHRPEKQGLGTAYLEGFRWALAHGYEVVVEMDADFSHDPQQLPTLLMALDGGADVAVGSRNVDQGGVEGWALGRHVLSRGGSLYARTVLGVGVRDLTTGYKAYRRDALAALDLGAVRSNGYAFQIETTYRALRRGLIVVEVPIVFVDRRVGQSKLSRRIFVEAVFEVWRLRFDAARGRI